MSWFLKRNLAGKKGLERSIWSHERQGPTSKITLSSKAIIYNGGHFICLSHIRSSSRSSSSLSSYYVKCSRDLSKKKKKIKTMNSKMTTNSQLSTNEPKRKEKQWKQKLSKQLEQEQYQRNGHHMEDFQWGGRGGKMEEKVQGIRSINGRYKIDRGRLRII